MSLSVCRRLRAKQDPKPMGHMKDLDWQMPFLFELNDRNKTQVEIRSRSDLDHLRFLQNQKDYYERPETISFLGHSAARKEWIRLKDQVDVYVNVLRERYQYFDEEGDAANVQEQFENAAEALDAADANSDGSSEEVEWNPPFHGSSNHELNDDGSPRF